MPGTVTINLKDAGLTHARGESDKCGDAGHDIAEAAITNVDLPGWLPAGEMWDILQALHVQAHPDGTRGWESCRERGCAEAYDLFGE